MTRISRKVVRHAGVRAKRSSMEIIIDYLTQEVGVVELNDEQQEMLDRWNFCDNLTRSGKYKKKEIEKMIMKKFNVGISTARTDVRHTEEVFGASLKMSKNYLLAVHRDRIDDFIVDLKRLGMWNEIPKLFDSYTKAVMAMPEKVEEHAVPVPLIFNITESQHLHIHANEHEEEFQKREAVRILTENEIDIDGLGLEKYLDDE